MALEDFERELAEGNSNSRESTKHNKKSGEDSERRHHRRHGHHHRSHRHRDSSRERKSRHTHKRHRERHNDATPNSEEKEERRPHKRRRSSHTNPTQPTHDKEADVKVFDSPDEAEEEEDEWIEKEAATAVAPPEEDILDRRDVNLKEEKLQRDAWMQAPSALDIESVASKKPKKQPGSQFVGASADAGMSMQGERSHISDLQRDLESEDEGEGASAATAGVPREEEVVNYTIGDSGSSWRMTKLRAVYRQAEESGRSVDDVATERYGDLRTFDEAREEERELERRKVYGKEYVGLERPSGELFQERKMDAGIRRGSRGKEGERVEGEVEAMNGSMPEQEQEAAQPDMKTEVLDPTALNKLKAQLMKAKLRNASNTAELEAEYNAALSAVSLANSIEPDVVVLNRMENRQMAGDRSGEVTAVSGKRGRERGLVVENEDMSIEDMVKLEKRTRGGGDGTSAGKNLAERIAKDGKFIDNLDYMDENAENLSKKVVQSDKNLRNAAIGDFQRMQRALDSCPLCYHEEKPDPTPTAPVVSLATRTYLTLPTVPELSAKGSGGGAVIVPIQHRRNLLECDDDEWEEIRNFMKSLTRHYDALSLGVIFYENAAHMLTQKRHAAMVAVPLTKHLVDTAPAYFKEAILASSEQWSQHKPIIDTLALSTSTSTSTSTSGRGGKHAFRNSMVKELPYFHVWFTLDGGMGHVIEDERRWPKGDLFAREIVGGMLDLSLEVVKKQGRWERGDAGVKKRVEGFRKRWGGWDWTRALMEEEEGG